MIVTRNIDEVRSSCFNLGQGCFEVGILLQISFFSYNLTTQFYKVFFEELGQAFSIVGGVIYQDSSLFNLQVFECIVCHYSALERVNEACTEVVFFGFFGFRVHSYVRVGAHGSDAQNLRTVVNCACCDNSGGLVRTNNCYNLILRNQLLHTVGCFRSLGFGIGYNQGELFAAQNAFFVDFLQSKVNTILRRNTEGSTATGHFQQSANLNGIACFASILGAATACQSAHKQCACCEN